MEGNFCGFTCSGSWCGEGFYLLSWWDCVGVMFHLDCGLSLFSGTLTDSYSPVLCVCVRLEVGLMNFGASLM